MKTTILLFTTLCFIAMPQQDYAQGIEAEEMAKILFEKSSIGISAGFSWRDRDDNSRTTFCLGGDYLRKFNNNPDCGGYIGGFASYHTSSQDEFKKNIFKLGPKIEYRIPISESRDTQLLTGIKGFYEIGSEENFGFKDDITGYGGSLYSGFNVRINAKWSIGLELPIVSYSNLTFKDENSNNETKQDNTTIALNKRNPAMAYSRIIF